MPNYVWTKFAAGIFFVAMSLMAHIYIVSAVVLGAWFIILMLEHVIETIKEANNDGRTGKDRT